MDYGTPGEELSQEFAMFMKNTMRSFLHGFNGMERTMPQVVAEILMNILQLPFSILYAMMTHNPTIAGAFKFIYMMFTWYLTVAVLVFAYFLLENIYKSFFTARLALLGRLRPWGLISALVGVHDTRQNDLNTGIVTRNNNFCVNVVKVPMTGLMLQVVVACVIDLVVAVIVSLAWPVTTSVFIITTLFTCRAPKVFYEYTVIENNSTQSGSIHETVRVDYVGKPTVEEPEITETPLQRKPHDEEEDAESVLKGEEEELEFFDEIEEADACTLDAKVKDEEDREENGENGEKGEKEYGEPLVAHE